MKLLLLPPYFTPEKQSSAMLDHQRYEAFANAGVEMSLFAPTPTRGISNEVREIYRNRKHELMYNNRMSVTRYPLIREGKNPIGRAIRYFLGFAKQFFIGIRQTDVDCIFLVSTPPIQGVLGGLLKKRLKAPFIYNIQDIFPDSLVGSGLAKRNGLLWKIGCKIEKFTYHHADKIIVISEDFKRNLLAKGVPEHKIEVVYNWVDQNAIVPIPKNENPLYDEFGINREKFNVVYAGNLGNAQNIDVIIDAAKIMIENKNVEFLIFGSGGLKDKYVEKIKHDNIDNVRFFPLQPIERVSQVYGLGDVCVVSCKPGLGGAAMPSKILSIMSAGRAVVASFDEGELTYILDKYKCGQHAPAGDVNAFVKVLRTISDNHEKCEEMGRNARNLILERFTREYGTQRYVDIIKSVVKRQD